MNILVWILFYFILFKKKSFLFYLILINRIELNNVEIIVKGEFVLVENQKLKKKICRTFSTIITFNINHTNIYKGYTSFWMFVDCSKSFDFSNFKIKLQIKFIFYY